MGMLPTANRSIAVTPVGVAAARILPPMPIPKLAARRFCTPTKNEAVCVASPAPLASLAPPCPVGSKKSSATSSLPDHPARPGPRGSHFHDTGTGRTLVVCAQKSPRLLEEYRQGHCFTDFLRVYAFVIPEEQHTAVGKETGETAHVERGIRRCANDWPVLCA
jgi:hypothetical protein